MKGRISHEETAVAAGRNALLHRLFPVPALFERAGVYLDPSATTYIVQAVAGVAVVIGTVAVMYWHKAKKKVQKALKLDEHSSKAKEADVVVSDDVLDEKK